MATSLVDQSQQQLAAIINQSQPSANQRNVAGAQQMNT